MPGDDPADLPALEPLQHLLIARPRLAGEGRAVVVDVYSRRLPAPPLTKLEALAALALDAELIVTGVAREAKIDVYSVSRLEVSTMLRCLNSHDWDSIHYRRILDGNEVEIIGPDA